MLNQPNRAARRTAGYETLGTCGNCGGPVVRRGEKEVWRCFTCQAAVSRAVDVEAGGVGPHGVLIYMERPEVFP